MPKLKRKRPRRNRQVQRELSDEKVLENLFTGFIYENKVLELEELLAIDQNVAILKQNRFLDPFVIAIKANNLHLIKFFLQYDFPLQTIVTKVLSCDDDCKLACCSSHSYCRGLTTAIRLSNEEALDICIQLNVNVNSNDYKNVPLQIAYNVYSAEREYSLVNSSYDKTRLEVNIFEKLGQIAKKNTHLVLLNSQKSFNVFKKLIENNADPNIYNHQGYRLIHQVILDKDLEVLELIIKQCKNLRVNALTYGKMQNSLHLISEFKRCIRYPSTSSTDTSSNASLNSSTDSVTSVQQPLNWTTSKPLMNMLNLKLARAMLEAGCNMDHTDYQSKETPVFKAIVYNYYDLVKYFVIEGMNMSTRNRSGNDVLSRSIQLGRYKIARLLIAADSPIRVYSCFYKIPNIDEFKATNAVHENNLEEEEDIYDEATINHENFLQFSIIKYEKFLTFIQKYTREPRSLLDLSRLVVRNELKKPLSKWLPQLKISSPIRDIILLKDIEKMIRND